MKILFITLLISLILLGLYACTSTNKTSKADTKEVLIRMSKSSCFGKCKVYNVQIQKDRMLIFEGIKNVDKMGIHQSILPESKYDNLSKLLSEIDFEKFDSEYLLGARDLQKVELEYQRKTVVFHKQKAPEPLISIMKMIDNLTP